MNKRKIRTVELFCGIGGFRLAAEAHGWKTVWANDIDPIACSVYRNSFDEHSLYEGDIWQLLDSIPDHDVLTAGFPCQPFSSAGKKQGIRDPRGNLFEVILKTLASQRPHYFVLENVKRLLTMEQGIHFATILDALTRIGYDIEWRLLNACHFGLPQNRERVVLVGTSQDHSSDEPPTALSARLVSNEDIEKHLIRDYSRFIDKGRWRCLESHAKRFSSWGLASNGTFVDADIREFSAAKPHPKLHTVLESRVHDMYDFTENTLERLRKNTPVNRFVNGVEILSNQSGGARMGYTIFGTAGIAPTLTSSSSRHYERYKFGDSYRRLTPTEYARLQGFPDAHCATINPYNQYALYGNAVPPPMIEWVFGRIKDINPIRLEALIEYQQELRL